MSVKTRIGVQTIITEEWASHILEQGVSALTIHGRTVREMSNVPAHWDEIAKVTPIRNAISPVTVLIGNGDVKSRSEAKRLANEVGMDGIMIGRGIFADIFAFADSKVETSPQERLQLLERHLDLYYATWADTKPYAPMKKFCKLYISSFDGASSLRAELMETKSIPEAKQLIERFLAVPA